MNEGAYLTIVNTNLNLTDILRYPMPVTWLIDILYLLNPHGEELIPWHQLVKPIFLQTLVTAYVIEAYVNCVLGSDDW